MQQPYIHCFRTSECCYLYDVNTDQIIKIPDFLYQALETDPCLTDASESAKAYAEELKSYCGCTSPGGGRPQEYANPQQASYQIQHDV